MHVEAIWRYPVKSMRGEQLQSARLTRDGVEGDRAVLVHAGQRIVTARTRPGLLGHAGTLGPDGAPLVDGRDWREPSVLADVRAVAGPDAELMAWAGPERFDILPLLVATDGAIEAFGRDGRRLRPNLVIGGVEGLAERTWPGRVLEIGDGVRIDVVDLRGRCVMTTVDPDSLDQDHGVLRDIVRRFDGELALNCAVLEPGTIRVGDPVRLR